MYPFNREQINQLRDLIHKIRNLNDIYKFYHQRSMSSTLWDNSDSMVSYAIEDFELAKCDWILIRKLKKLA